ncbi:MAG TPA: alpha/beta fold hydrolase [Lysobacter sp.]|jgi:hypothetical protein|nr:alpha/beta fold hydrolase [Lysobacter sp.]
MTRFALPTRAGNVIVILGLCCAVSAIGQTADPSLDAVAADPTTFDAAFPAATRSFKFASGGVPLNGRALIAQGKGPHPTVILLHGLPGIELNLDLAQAIRRAGWNVLMFHYRGSWGSGGDFSFSNVLQDVDAAVAHVRSPATAADLRIDMKRIALVGHSMGGFAALTAAARDPEIHAVASISGWDVGLAGTAARSNTKMVDFVSKLLSTSTELRVPSTDAVIQEWLAKADDWLLAKSAPALTKKSVLLVAASRDTVVPPARYHAPLLQALQEQKAGSLTEVTLESDHSYSDRRIALSKAVVSWLERQK